MIALKEPEIRTREEVIEEMKKLIAAYKYAETAKETTKVPPEQEMWQLRMTEINDKLHTLQWVLKQKVSIVPYWYTIRS